MKYTQEMMLNSDSGYCMPFEERDKEVEMTLGYGKQKHPKNGQTFYHNGVDFNAPYYMLSAIATGKVTGIGNDATHGLYLIIHYGDYEVNYSHLSNVFVGFGRAVRAGLVVAISADMLHVEVKYKGETINPLEFLTMVYCNLKSLEAQGKTGMPELVGLDFEIRTRYDNDHKEIEELMMKFLPNYLQDMQSGIYHVPEHTEQALRNIFTMSAIKNYFFEMLPNISNPLGIGRKSIPLAEKVQNLFIEDFLNYLALNHHVFLSSLSAFEKKKRKKQHSSAAD